MKDIPIWAIIWIVLPPLIIVSVIFLIRFRKKEHNLSLRKRRKRSFVILGILIVFLLIMTIITHIMEVPFWQDQFANIGSLIQWLIFIAIFIYAFFRKDKIQKPTEEIETKINE